MQMWRNKIIFVLALYALVLGVASAQKPNDIKPLPGSEGDTLTREDARMAYLVYKLLDKDGNIIGADLKRGDKLFFQNCRPCHGEDGMRINFNPGGKPEFIGIRARNDMPTFWYQMNFGDEDRNMEAYYDEISLDEMRDIAAFAKTLP
ncbi:MAG: c-type cytochrome [Fibrobacter sp.]|jgi:mono/diheme cytochrome c family protein|uniref:c-type cytochrome n=1 Tax=Fibrobacter sp. UWP2 TaxID=1896216 RepID=UPI00091F7C98|nr:c-type cytochrome [Fibrobacter sp. UWP2]MBO7383158.1 c-type cytochrome [Fibrobacter sp.]MCR5378173.1 c-type cytochrome [Fibrobacter sp.]SHI52823.1 Cytochrome C oxidase, cbb3-type, subunit III [Fibrobacter sp. UWP2]